MEIFHQKYIFNHMDGEKIHLKAKNHAALIVVC